MLRMAQDSFPQLLLGLRAKELLKELWAGSGAGGEYLPAEYLICVFYIYIDLYAHTHTYTHIYFNIHT